METYDRLETNHITTDEEHLNFQTTEALLKLYYTRNAAQHGRFIQKRKTEWNI